MDGRAVVRLVVTLVAAVGGAVAGGYVIDGAGRPAIGFWAAVWGTSTFLVVGALSLLVGTRRSATRRVAKSILGVTLAAVAYGVGFFAMGTSPLSLSGAWLWPLTIVSFAGAVWAIRGAVSRRP